MSDFFAGACSGISQTIIGHPFDTAKVNIQNNISLKTLKLKDSFRGIKYPLLSNALINSIVFSGYQNNKEIVKSIFERNNSNELNEPNKQNNNIVNFLSGGIAGLYVAPIIYFFDYGKTFSQMGKQIGINDYIKLIKREKYPYGLKTTFGREFLAFSVYFSSYDYMREEMNLSPLIAGGLSGLANWTTTYNLDVIRNRQIYQSINFIDAMKQGKLWKGFTFCALRALIVNSVGFYVYELCK
jgi:solute carrier family 25 carnitine/acylcarnitine transporter 20/29